MLDVERLGGVAAGAFRAGRSDQGVDASDGVGAEHDPDGVPVRARRLPMQRPSASGSKTPLLDPEELPVPAVLAVRDAV